MTDKKTIIGVIPARYNSSRLPGKPLVDIGGKPMIQWVAERAARAVLISRIIVATDDRRIFETVKKFGCEAVMTPSTFSSGTDRVAFVAKDIDAEIVVNIQGDEPFIEPEEIDLVARILVDDKEAVVGTLVKKITRIEELKSFNTAKVVIDEKNNAIYFSRSPIPFFRDKDNFENWIKEHTYYKHVGIYSFRKDFLLQYAKWEPTALEKVEKLEQLRVLGKGYKIKVAETEFEPVCVDTPEDLEKVQRFVNIRQNNI